MGFPRKDDFARIYRDKDGQSYFVVFTDMVLLHSRNGPEYDAIANVYPGPKPSLVGTQVSRHYIAHNWLKRMQFDELPEDYQDAIRRYLGSGPGDDRGRSPESIRGFWRI